MSGLVLRDLVQRSDTQPALVVPETATTVTYDALQRALDRACGRLRALGVSQGDRIAIAAPNGPALVVAFLAISALDAAAAPLNPAFGPGEVENELGDLRITRLLHDPNSADAIAAAARLGVKAHVITFEDLDLLIDGAGGPPALPASVPTSVALLLHTSGTTSKPKTVPISQANLVASTGAVVTTYGLDSSDVTMCVMPLFHVHGLVAAVLATLTTGGTIIVPARFRASTFWDDVERFGATWYTAVPTIHSHVLGHDIAKGSPHRLRFARSCSAPLPTVLWQRFEDAVGVPLAEAYGMTEAAHQMASNPLPPGERRAGTVGRATGVEIAILDDGWRPLPAGERGEVSVRGPSVIDGYLDNPDATAASFRDGWFRTGDVGTLSADGYLTLVGRVKELINRGGEKISPYEIEDVLLTHPAVAEAAAYSMPDATYGEQVGVVVVLNSPATPDELVEHCAQRLAAFKLPARISVLPEIPKGATGKIQRRNLAQLVGE